MTGCTHSADTRHRSWVILRGERSETEATIATWCAQNPFLEVTHVGGPRRSDRRDRAPELGTSAAVVALDLHDGVRPDLLAQAHGLVLGGGLLVLRLPPSGTAPVAGWERLAVHPFAPEDVGGRLLHRIERALEPEALGDLPAAVTIAVRRGTDEQRAMVDELAAHLEGRSGSRALVLAADRGRGKSSAIGLAIARLAEDADTVVVVAPSAESAAEITSRAPAGRVRWVAPRDAARGLGDPSAIVVDEAAQIPVPVLQQIVLRNPTARLVFSTTTGGYEGTGRGFSLRFVHWMRRHTTVDERTLSEPIRWGSGCPLERAVFDALLLDASPAVVSNDAHADAITTVELEREVLAHDEALLREVFGLLVDAHYRTTPDDLHRMLDAPNLRVHAARAGQTVVGVTLVALEGGLPPEVCDDVFSGRTPLRGHALADSLISHLGERDAGLLRMVRSVRIAVHPALRRRGVATALIEHVHRTYSPDLFGTLFGATAELLGFRRAVGYELVRVSASRGARSGEPAALMLRPNGARAHALVARLRAELARDLPTQLALLERGGDLLLEEPMRQALLAGLPEVAPRSDAEVAARVAAYATGPRTYESVAADAERYVRQAASLLTQLARPERLALEARVLEREPWDNVVLCSGVQDERAAMRAVRRGIRSLVALRETTDPAAR